MPTATLRSNHHQPHSDADVCLYEAPDVTTPTFLIVDDDYGTRRFLHTLLTRVTGGRVLDAANPLLALRTALTIDRPVDLLISDIDLGSDIDGVQLALRRTQATSWSGQQPAPFR